MNLLKTHRTKAIAEIRFTKLTLLLIAILMMIPGCATTNMSLEEAKKVSLLMDQTSVARPPRHITDILAVLDQPGQFDDSVTKQFKSKVTKSLPSGAKDEELYLFYKARGEAAGQLGHIKQALEDLRKALMYAEKSGYNDRDLLLFLGRAEQSAGNLQKAVNLLQKAHSLKGNMGTYRALIGAFITMGDMEAVENLSRTVKDTWLRNGPGGPTANYTEASLYGVMSAVLEAQGRYAESEQYLRKMLFLLHSKSVIELAPSMAILGRINLSRNLIHQHRLTEAEIEARQVVKEALGFGGRESYRTGMAVDCLASVMLAQGRINDAEQLVRSGVRLFESSGLPSDSIAMARARLFLGSVLSRKGDFSEAVKQFDLAREGMKENSYLYETMIAKNSTRMLTLLKLGRNNEAMGIISQVYDLNRKIFGEKHHKTIVALGLRGMANTMAGNNRQAFDDFSSALPVLMRQGGRQGVPDQSQSAILETYIDFLGRVYGTPLERELGVNASEEAFRIVSYLSGQTVQTALGESSARAAASYDKDLSDLVRREQDMHKQIQALEENLSDAMMAPSDQQNSKALNTLKATIDNLTVARRTILDEINKRFPQYANFTSAQPVTVEKVRENLHQNEALISIFTADDKTYIWAVPQKGKYLFSVTPLGRKDLTQMVTLLRKALDPKPNTLGDIPDFDLIQAYDLYRRLLKPIEPAWLNAKDLLITINGPLGNLPLSLLPTEPVHLTDKRGELFANYRQVPWLIRKASVTMLPSVNALLTLRSLPEGDAKRKAFAGFGDPIFNLEQLAIDNNPLSNKLTNRETTLEKVQLASRGLKIQVRGVRITEKGNLDNDKIASVQLDSLERLPDTAEEIRSIAQVLKADTQNDIFLGKDFSNNRLQTMNLSDRRVIAFATHALVPGDLDGLDQPALALSSPSVTGGKGDGLLTTDEILKMKLNTDWVVLSACNTGAAEGQGAEAVSGLGRAFFYAGTRALLVSMWSVETTSAHKLVTGIFQSQEENKGLSRAQALRKSMLNLIDKETMKDATGKIAASYAHPLFWAPFVIVGDPGKSL